MLFLALRSWPSTVSKGEMLRVEEDGHAEVEHVHAEMLCVQDGLDGQDGAASLDAAQRPRTLPRVLLPITLLPLTLGRGQVQVGQVQVERPRPLLQSAAVNGGRETRARARVRAVACRAVACLGATLRAAACLRALPTAAPGFKCRALPL